MPHGSLLGGTALVTSEVSIVWRLCTWLLNSMRVNFSTCGSRVVILLKELRIRSVFCSCPRWFSLHVGDITPSCFEVSGLFISL